MFDKSKSLRCQWRTEERFIPGPPVRPSSSSVAGETEERTGGFPTEPIATSCWVWPNLAFLYRPTVLRGLPKGLPLHIVTQTLLLGSAVLLKDLLTPLAKQSISLVLLQWHLDHSPSFYLCMCFLLMRSFNGPTSSLLPTKSLPVYSFHLLL